MTRFSSKLPFSPPVPEVVEQSASEAIQKITAIQSLFDETLAQVRQQAPKVYSKELVEVLFEYPYSKIEFIVDRLAIDRRTASKYLRALEALGILKAEQKWKETLFINTRLFDLLRG